MEVIRISYKYIKQDGSKDCGVCTLYNIIKYYGGSIDINKLRTLTKTDENGTSIYDIVDTANNLGLISNAYKCELNNLYKIKLPIIAHLKFENSFSHFVIIDKIINNEIIIFDPIRGKIKYSIDNFSKEWNNIIITFEKTNNIVMEKENHKTDFLQILNKYKNKILLIVILSLALSLLGGINSFYLSNLYVSNNKMIILISFCIILILKLIIEVFRNKKLLLFNKKLDIDITSNTYNKILSLPIQYHHERPVGDVVTRINDVSSIKNFITEFSFTTILDILFIFIICIFMFFINPYLSYFSVLFVSTLTFIYIIMRRKIKDYIIKVKEKASNVNTLLLDGLLGIDTIKNLNIKRQIYDKYEKEYETFSEYNFILNKKISNMNLILDFLFNSFTILILFLGIKLIEKNDIMISDLITFNSLLIYLFSSVKNIINIDNTLMDAKNSLSRIQNLYKENDILETDNNFSFKEKINVKNLNYSYNGVNNIFNNVNFNIIKGEFVFIEGKSGIGKSTIFKLLTKQLSINHKKIYIDNIDINNISRNDIVNNICYVSQNEYIFTDSILNNIKMYKDVSLNELNKVLKITGVDKILNRRKIDLNFILNENGQNISGGERQRILLARSLLGNKKILILDETMNEIDIKSEREIIKKIKTEYNITFILISHRNINSDLFDKVIKIE